MTIEQVEVSPSYFGVKPEDLNVHAAAAREDSRPMPSRPGGHVRGATGMQGSAHKDKVRGLASNAKWNSMLLSPFHYGICHSFQKSFDCKAG